MPFACEMLNDLLLCKRNISVVPRRKIRSLEKEKEKFRADENGLEKIEKISVSMSHVCTKIIFSLKNLRNWIFCHKNRYEPDF